jgi:LPXTG-motif cell wall-anchored protein
MKMHTLIPARTRLAIICGVALAASVVATPARADEWNKKTVLTVNETTQLTDTVLAPGQYVLRLLDSQSDRHIVQIFNGDETHIINTVLAIPAERLQPTGKTEFSFWETPPGTARALRTWYYPGDNFGQEFPYPKHLQQVAMLMPPALAPVAAAVETNAAPAPVETAAQSEVVQTPEPAPEQPVEVAQNTVPAPAPAEPQAQPTPEQPAELPKTGSPYPAIGISGALLLGLAGLLRLRRQA